MQEATELLVICSVERERIRRWALVWPKATDGWKVAVGRGDARQVGSKRWLLTRGGDGVRSRVTTKGERRKKGEREEKGKREKK